MLHKQIFVATIIAAFIPAVFAQSSEPSQPDSPEMTRLVHCHGNYAVAHASSSATPTEIATAAMTACYSELEAVGNSTYQQALTKKLPLEYAQGARDQVVNKMKELLPGFVIGIVMEERGKDKKGGS